jgi:hypothetical protein
MATLYWGPSGGTSTGTWNSSSTTNWFTDVGRTTPASAAPTAIDDVVFDAASDNGTTFNVTLGVGAVCRDVTISNLDFTMTLTHSNPWVVYGSLSFPSTRLTRAGFNDITFAATTSTTVNFNGYVLDNAVIFNGVGGAWQLLSGINVGDNTRTNLSCTLTNGTIDLNGFAMNTHSFRSSNTNARALLFGTGKVTLYGNGTNVWGVQNATNFSYTGTPTVEGIYAGATGGRNFFHGSSAGATEANTPDFYVLGGTDTVGFANTRRLDFTGFSGTWAAGGVSVYGDLKFSIGMTVGSTANNLSFRGTTGPRTITSAGKTINQPVAFDGVGGSWQFEDDFSVVSTQSVTLTNGTLNGNGKNVSLGTFALGAGTKTLTLGGGTWNVTGSGSAWNANTNVTNLTVSASTGTISMTSASAKTFAGGGKVWPTLNQGGAGALTIQQSNTFTNITDTVQPATITLTAGTTQTVSAFSVFGTAGNLITLNSSAAGSQATLSDASGTNSISFVSIKDVNATGGAIWDAPTTEGNVDAGNNTGWNFGIPFNYDIEFSPSLRSFTERRHF